MILSGSGHGVEYVADSAITDRLETEFWFDPAVPFNTVDVSTERGIVSLTGEVNNLLARERATRIAESLRGVRAVVNRIAVEPVVDWTSTQLSDMVTDALIYDSATEAYEIVVMADDSGEVTLSGTVDSWTERDLAESVAKGVSGVVSIRNNINVSPSQERPDSEIKWDVDRRLYWDTLINDELITVRCEEGMVSLSGTVGSAVEKTRAVRDARAVIGVKDVDASALQVEKWAHNAALREQSPVTRTDAEIRDAVRDALQYDPRVSDFEIEVKADNGNVTLRGVVDNIKARYAAGRDARNTVGVIAVNNLIKIRPVSAPDDEVIAANVLAALLRHPYIDSDNITVLVKDQEVTLTGSVDSSFEKVEAESVAYRASGVTGVRNHLAINQPAVLVEKPYLDDWSIYDFVWYLPVPGNKSDAEIREDIEEEFLWSPFVDGDDVKVSVEAGVATLTGSVDSLRESSAARENAFEGGAIAVINKLQLEE
jgi:osmotically-inducible protein OsmY